MSWLGIEQYEHTYVNYNKCGFLSGCELCPKTCGTCHGGNEICPMKCKDYFDEEFCQNVVDEGKCDDDEMLHYCTKTCTNCTESIFIPGH